ncbi:MAG: hypothetical protein H6595_01255 [Flavobacteriales bacterium]|nr:hypothetical protein [Flavobacteriales bacterium]MCB9166086.1 hypothetical protein [Flavobacteriales bacterium]
MRSIDWKRHWPIAAILALFFALSLAYFSPVLEGKRLVQGDKSRWQGMAQEIQEYRDMYGSEPLWTESMFSGMPAYQISVIWSQDLLRFVDRLFHGFLPRPASFLFLYLVGMFILLCCLRVDPWLALFGSIAFAFSSYFFVILEAGHNSKANAIGYMPAVLGGLYLLYRGRKWLGAALFALFLALEVSMNHVQITYYLGLVMALFVLAELVRAVREKELAAFALRSGLGVVAIGFALACNLGLLWSTWEYGKYTTRGKSELTIGPDGKPAADIRTSGLDRDYVVGWSYGKEESFSLLIPNAKGGPTAALGGDPDVLAKADPRFRENIARMNRYWGDQSFTSGPVYVGALVVLLMLLLFTWAEERARWYALGALGLVAVLLAVDAPLLAGVLVIAYLLAGPFLWKEPLPFALFGGLVLTLLLSWGKNYMPLTDFFLDHVPAYNKFRAVTIILVIVELAVPVLAVLFLDKLVRNGGWDRKVERRALIMAGAVLLLLIAFAAAPGNLTSLVSDAERDAFNAQANDPKMEAQVIAFVQALKEVRASILSADALRSLLFVVAGGALVFLFGRRKIRKPVLLLGLSALVLLDLWSVDKRYVNNTKDRGRYVQWESDADAAIPFKPGAADMAILDGEENAATKADLDKSLERLKESKADAKGRDKLITDDERTLLRFGSLRRTTHFRVLTLNNPFNDARTSFFHKSLGGYHGAKLKRYQELIEFHLTPEVAAINAALKAGTDLQAMNDLMARQPVLTMLNARYLIYADDRAPIRNLNAAGVGWFVDQVKWAKDADGEIMDLDGFDPLTTAVIDERYRTELGGEAASDPAATVELKHYRTDEMTYTVNSANGGVVVFSEIWYGPDWHVTIDGNPADHVRADYVLRAMHVPAGRHEIVFRIASTPYAVGSKVMLAGSALLILLVLGALVMELRRPREEAA